MRLMNCDQMEVPYLRALLYGKPGSTKTRTAGTAALDDRTYPTLWIDIAGNPTSIRSYSRLPTILQLEKLADFNLIYDFLTEQRMDHVIAKELKLTQPFKCVVIDGGTEVQRQAFRSVIGNTKLGPGDMPAIAEIQHFNRVLGYMVQFAYLWFKLPLHVIMTTLEAERKDEVTGAVNIGPLIWGQSAEEMGGYALLVARLVHRSRLERRTETEIDAAVKLHIVEDPITSETVSVAILKPTGKMVAKNQYCAGVPYIVDPTVTKILDMIQEHRS
jgi:hypothetical protein